MNYTNNYHLPQWVETDRIQMEDFNQAMADIDQGLQGAKTAADSAQSAAAALPYVTGRYTGAGATAQSIALGFKPSYLIISGQGGGSDDASKSIGIFFGWNMSSKVTFTNTGFTVAAQTNDSYPQLNRQYAYYGYIAFR